MREGVKGEWRRRESKPLRPDPPSLGTRATPPVFPLKMGRPSVRASPGASVRFGPFLVPLDPWPGDKWRALRPSLWLLAPMPWPTNAVLWWASTGPSFGCRALVASNAPIFACPTLTCSSQNQPPRLPRLLPLRLSGAARSVRGRLRLLGAAGPVASGDPASSSAGSRAHVPSSQRFNAWDASNGTSPWPFAASSKTALASAVRWRNSSAAADTRTSMRGCVKSTASASRPVSP